MRPQRAGLASPGLPTAAAAAEIPRERDLLSRLAAGPAGVAGREFLRRLVAEVAAALDADGGEPRAARARPGPAPGRARARPAGGAHRARRAVAAPGPDRGAAGGAPAAGGGGHVVSPPG